MLKGSALGAALKEAMQLKKVTQAVVAKEFDIAQPSVSNWIKTGRIDKEHINHLVTYFADVVGPDHWGLPRGPDVVYHDAAGNATQAKAIGPSERAASLAERFDALTDPEHRRIAYALIDNTLQQFEAEARTAVAPTTEAAPRSKRAAPRQPARAR